MVYVSRLVLVLSLGAMPALACGPRAPGMGDGASVSVGRMAGLDLTVTHLAGQPVAADAGLWLNIEPDGAVSGQAGCNRFFGQAEMDAGVMIFGPLAATEMSCAPDVMEREAKFLNLLPEVRSFAVGPEGGLWLTREDGTVAVCLE